MLRVVMEDNADAFTYDLRMCIFNLTLPNLTQPNLKAKRKNGSDAITYDLLCMRTTSYPSLT